MVTHGRAFLCLILKFCISNSLTNNSLTNNSLSLLSNPHPSHPSSFRTYTKHHILNLNKKEKNERETVNDVNLVQ